MGAARPFIPPLTEILLFSFSPPFSLSLDRFVHPFVREMIICVLVFRGGAEVERFLGTVYDYPYRKEHENLLPPRLDRFTVAT